MRKKSEVQEEQHVEKGYLKKNEEMQAYNPPIPFFQRLQKSKMEDQFSKLLNMFKNKR